MDVPSTDTETAQWAAQVSAVWGRRRTWERETCTGASFAFHGAFLVMFFLMPPRPPSLTPDLLTPDAPHVRALLPPEAPFDPPPSWMDGTEGRSGERHEGESGAMGVSAEERHGGRYAIEGRARVSEARLPAATRSDARTIGVLGVLAQRSGQWASPTSHAGVGADPMSALGSLMGDQIGESFGFGGLGLSGVGRGGGGSGLGTIGNGVIGTLGHGAGRDGTGGSGYGAGAGGFRGRASRVPSCGCGDAEARGGLSRESVRRVIRQHLNEVRFCYEQGLAERPDLAGRVTVTFLVAPTGTVSTSSVTSSTIEDRRVDQCVATAVRRWTFPSADGATLVTYPLVFDSAP